jgi:hypothetical protein
MHAFLTEGTGTRLNRAQLQQRLLRHTSYSQGNGKPLALDLVKITKVVRDGKTNVAWPESTPEIVTGSVAFLESRMAAIGPLFDEAVGLVPDLTDLGGEISEVAGELLTLVNERSAAGALPGGISPAELHAAARAVKTGDQRKVESAYADLARWGELTPDDRLQVLNGDWDDAVQRVSAWLRLATRAIDLLARNLGNGTASDAHREYSDARQQLIGDLTAMADTITGAAPAIHPEEMA